MNKAQMDCFTKTVTLQRPNGKKIVFRGGEMSSQTVLSQLWLLENDKKKGVRLTLPMS